MKSPSVVNAGTIPLLCQVTALISSGSYQSLWSAIQAADRTALGTKVIAFPFLKNGATAINVSTDAAGTVVEAFAASATREVRLVGRASDVLSRIYIRSSGAQVTDIRLWLNILDAADQPA